MVPLSSHGLDNSQEESQNKLNLGAIIDNDSRAGREEKVAMQIAIEDFCVHSSHCPTLLVNDSQGDPIQTALLGKLSRQQQHFCP